MRRHDWTLFGTGPEDVIYGSGMPLYHSAANLGVLGSMFTGSCYIIRTKFSARQHLADCATYGATVMQYIGELCRYLLSTEPGPKDQAHKLRVAIGNGLRPEIWDRFQRRFNVPEIGEFYASTEGNGFIWNHCREYQDQGAVGVLGTVPTSLVKFDLEPNDAGELLWPIVKAQTGDGDFDNFEGYTNKEATEKKIARDVFEKGDSFFRSGDLLRRDEKGRMYFVDRIGDTFRWKGENVSTMEVSEVLSAFPGVVDANVYGAQVPGKDGRACMVALTVSQEQTMDMQAFATYCRANLPSYSVPVFLRFLKEDINLTGTFKHQKVDYRNQGCDPAQISDELWWFNAATGAYEPYNQGVLDMIMTGQAKL